MRFLFFIRSPLLLLIIFGVFFSFFTNFLFAAEASLKSKTIQKPASGEYKIVIVGDSLTEGYGVAKEKSYPFLVEQKLNKTFQNKKFKIINNGISGSTTSGVKQRIQWAFKSEIPNLIIIALGANDGLRGLQPQESEKNMAEAIQWLQEQKIKVILFGMEMPPNYGDSYRKKFSAMYLNLQKKYKIPLMPLFIKNVIGRPELNQPDGIHPNEKGHEILAEDIFQFLKNKI